MPIATAETIETERRPSESRLPIRDETAWHGRGEGTNLLLALNEGTHSGTQEGARYSVGSALSGSGIATGGTSTASRDVLAIYPQTVAQTQRLHFAVRLLSDLGEHLSDAEDEARIGNSLNGDIYLQQASALLPRLFSCHQIGDGFGAIIAAFHACLVNRSETFLSARQIQSMSQALEVLQKNPFMSHDIAVDIIISMEEVGLNVDPEILGVIFETEA